MEALSGLRYAATFAGQAGEVLDKALIKLNTRLSWAGSGYLVTLGNNAAVLSYGTSITDLRIEISNSAGCGVLCYGTAGAQVERLYIEGAVAASRSSIGVGIDGANISGFFNRIKDVQCNHIHVGFSIFTSGSQIPTCQYLDNCSSFGDVGTDASSQGIQVFANCGAGSVVTGGNMESVGQGLTIAAGAGAVTWVGIRFEPGNTFDIVIGATPQPQIFLGLLFGTGTISDSSGTGYTNHTYLGCKNGSGALRDSTIPGTNIFQASRSSADIPVRARGYPAQTSNILQVENSSGTPNFGVTPAGAITSNAGIAINGVGAPPAQITGFGTPTGNAVVANFPGASATLVQCSNTISEILTILKSIGVIGA